MGSVTLEQLLTFAVVAVVLIGVYNAIASARNNHRQEEQRRNQPTVELSERISRHDEILASDKRRLERLEKESSEHNDEMKLLLSSQLALLRHGIDGNNIQGLKDSQGEIQQYLVNK